MTTWTVRDEAELQDWMDWNKLGIFYQAKTYQWGCARQGNKPLYWFNSAEELKMFLIKKMLEDKKKNKRLN